MNDKYNKIHDIIFVIVFLSIIMLPICFFHNEEGRISYVENKVSEPKPDLTNISMWNSEFTNSIENYVCDRIGFRDEMILVNIAFMNSLFHDFEVTNVIKGKEQHTFYMNPSIMDCYQGLDEISSDQMTEIVNEFQLLNNTVNNTGMTFEFMPIPNKDSIYPEYMPDNIKIISDNSMLKSIKNYLQVNTDITVIDVYTALENAKNEDDLLYYRNYDASHWNMRGALVGYLELMNTLNSKTNENYFRNLDINDYIINKEQIHYAVEYLQKYNIIKSTFSDMEDYMYSVEPINGFTGQQDNNSSNVYLHYYNQTLPYKKSVLIIGDSYVHSFLLPLLAENFTDVYFVAHSCSPDDIANTIKTAAPDHIIFEVVERMTTYDYLKAVVQSLNSAVKIAADVTSPRNITDVNWTNGVLNDNHNVILFGKDACSVEFTSGMKLILENGTEVIVQSVSETDIDYIVTFDEILEESYECSQYPHNFFLSNKGQ